jgi:hypothetical protein
VHPNPPKPRTVLGIVKAISPTGGPDGPALTMPARGAPGHCRSGRRNGRQIEQRNRTR